MQYGEVRIPVLTDVVRERRRKMICAFRRHVTEAQKRWRENPAAANGKDRWQQFEIVYTHRFAKGSPEADLRRDHIVMLEYVKQQAIAMWMGGKMSEGLIVETQFILRDTPPKVDAISEPYTQISEEFTDYAGGYLSVSVFIATLSKETRYIHKNIFCDEYYMFRQMLGYKYTCQAEKECTIRWRRIDDEKHEQPKKNSMDEFIDEILSWDW